MQKPAAIVLDLGGTIARLHAFDIPSGQRRLFDLAINPRDVPFDVLRAVADPLAHSLFGPRDSTLVEYPLTSFNRLLYERFGMRFALSPEEIELEFWRAVVDFSPEPGIAEALALIRNQGIETGVLTNCSFHEHVVAWELECMGLRQYLSFIMSSADYGCRKPHPAFFQAAAGRLNRDARHIWYIGDSLEQDIEGAQGAGLSAVWYNPGGSVAHGVVPDAELQHWQDLCTLLERAAA